MASTKARSKLPEGMRLRGKVYYAWFKHQGREVRKRLSSDLKVAVGLFHDLRARLERGDWGMLDNDCSWKEVKDQFLVFARQTLRNPEQYEADLNRFERFRPIQSVKQIDSRFIITYRQWRMAKRIGNPPRKGEPDRRPFVTPRTANREVGIMVNVLNRAVEWGLIGSNPIGKIKHLKHDRPTKNRRALSIEEIEALFSVLPEYLRPVIRFIMTTGVRRDEAVELFWSDVDLEAKVATIRAEVAKSHKAREIPLDDDMVEMLHGLKSEAKERQPVAGRTAKQTDQQAASFSRDHVFVNRVNTPWRHNLLEQFYRYAQKAGIADARPRGAVDLHSLRVTFVTHCINGGASPKAVQAIVGHSSLDLTMRTYTKATDQAKRAAISALPFAKATNPSHLLKLVPAQPEASTGYKAGTKVLAST